MARFVLFLILLVPLTAVGNWLVAHPGNIRIDWLGYEIEMATGFAVVLLSVVLVLLVLLALGLWQLATWPERRRARRRYRTVSRGLQHLTQGMTALALGHEDSAESALRKARATLPGEPLPTLLTAQLLQRQGRHEEARGQFRRLLAHPSTATLATHRLIEQHVSRREWAEAEALAAEAQRDTPRDRWLALTRIDLEARLGNTAGMKALTEGWHWQSPLSRDERHRYAAMAYLLSAGAAAGPQAQLADLRHAHSYAPDFLPAALAYAEALSEAQDYKRARKVLLTAWEAQPVQALIAPIMKALGPSTPRQQKRLLKPFLQQEAAAAHLLAAHQALEEGDFVQVKASAAQALALEESKDGCALMAEAEKQLSGPEAATVWFARGMDAPRDNGWICHRCGHAHVAWQTHCGGCDTFDTLRYERPEARVTSVEVAPVATA